MSFKSFVAASAILASASAHMIMESPKPFVKPSSDPIKMNNYPCQSNLGFAVESMNAMPVGEEQTLKITGGAIHGGGSCQLSVTLDKEPSATSVFKVIKSIEGGCPGISSPTPFKFTLPPSIPNGQATFAWTWFGKTGGLPEMYMNCAPIEVTGGASDKSGFDALPDMLVANSASETCKGRDTVSIKFPNPGEVLENGGDNALELPKGDCGATGSAPPPAASSAAPVTPPAASSAAPVTPPAASSAAPVTPPAASSAAPVTPPAASSAAPVTPPAASSAAPVSPPAASSAAPISAPAPTTLVPVPSAAPAPSATPVTPPMAPPATGGTTCTANGTIVCNGPTQFGLCNNGSVVWQPVAAGTTCNNGSIMRKRSNSRIARRAL